MNEPARVSECYQMRKRSHALFSGRQSVEQMCSKEDCEDAKPASEASECGRGSTVQPVTFAAIEVCFRKHSCSLTSLLKFKCHETMLGNSPGRGDEAQHLCTTGRNTQRSMI